jgi:hypothetical protein
MLPQTLDFLYWLEEKTCDFHKWLVNWIVLLDGQE